jgi:hypothetical protein
MYQYQTASQCQAQQPPKRSALVAGLGAAFVASGISFAIMMSSASPVAAPAQAMAATASSQCQMVQRQFLVSTTAGSGTVRLREGSYLSPPITLSTRPQAVVFPLLRPQDAPVTEVITIEGNATDVVLTSPVTAFRRVFDNVTGVSAFPANWMPIKTC